MIILSSLSFVFSSSFLHLLSSLFLSLPSPYSCHSPTSPLPFLLSFYFFLFFYFLFFFSFCILSFASFLSCSPSLLLSSSSFVFDSSTFFFFINLYLSFFPISLISLFPLLFSPLFSSSSPLTLQLLLPFFLPFPPFVSLFSSSPLTFVILPLSSLSFFCLSHFVPLFS